MSDATEPKSTNAFYMMSIISFIIAVGAMGIGIFYLPVDGWMRGFLAIGELFLINSSLTLAKVVRDKHESSDVVRRIDQVRMQRMLAEHDPLKQP